MHELKNLRVKLPHQHFVQRRAVASPSSPGVDAQMASPVKQTRGHRALTTRTLDPTKELYVSNKRRQYIPIRANHHAHSICLHARPNDSHAAPSRQQPSSMMTRCLQLVQCIRQSTSRSGMSETLRPRSSLLPMFAWNSTMAESCINNSRRSKEQG